MSFFSHNKAIIVNIKFAIVLHAHYAVSAVQQRHYNGQQRVKVHGTFWLLSITVYSVKSDLHSEMTGKDMV